MVAILHVAAVSDHIARVVGTPGARSHCAGEEGCCISSTARLDHLPVGEAAIVNVVE